MCGLAPRWGAGQAGQGEGWGAADLGTPLLAGGLRSLAGGGTVLVCPPLGQRSGGAFWAVRGLAQRAGAHTRLRAHSISTESTCSVADAGLSFGR